MNRIAYGLLAAAAVGVVVVLAFVLFDGSDVAKGREKALVARRAAIRDAAGKKGGDRREWRIDPARNGAPAADSVGSGSNRVEQALKDPKSDPLLEKVIAELLVEIESEMKAKDSDKVAALVGKLREKLNGSLARSGLSGSAKLRVLAALEGSGFAGLSQVFDLLGDSDPAVVASAKSLLFETLNDLSLGDFKRGEIVVEACKEMTDRMDLYRLYQEFVKMRPSVGVTTFSGIEGSGTDEAKALLASQIAAFTRNPENKTAAAAQKWFAQEGDPKDTRPYEPIVRGGAK